MQKLLQAFLCCKHVCGFQNKRHSECWSHKIPNKIFSLKRQGDWVVVVKLNEKKSKKLTTTAATTKSTLNVLNRLARLLLVTGKPWRKKRFCFTPSRSTTIRIYSMNWKWKVKIVSECELSSLCRFVRGFSYSAQSIYAFSWFVCSQSCFTQKRTTATRSSESYGTGVVVGLLQAARHEKCRARIGDFEIEKFTLFLFGRSRARAAHSSSRHFGNFSKEVKLNELLLFSESRSYKVSLLWVGQPDKACLTLFSMPNMRGFLIKLSQNEHLVRFQRKKKCFLPPKRF